MDRERFTNQSADWQGLAVAVVLMLTGLLLMTGDGLGILSLASIQNLWPVALILIGLGELLPVPAEQKVETTINVRR